MRLMRDLVGHTLSGRYRLVARLAGGGMGEVYRGHDTLLDRSVAVKVLQPSLATDADLVERFRNEARAAARLSHPNVVAVYDWGREDEHTYYMVMEFISGTDLRDLLVTRGALKPAQALEVVGCLCEALAAAHATGLVHRDIKPENVLIDRNGQVKVADFGIAVVNDAERTAPGGAIPGTLRYLSPEQARGEEATVASDIWAAGAVLSELVTGRPVQQAAGAELLHRRASEPVPAPSSVERSVPRAVDDVVAKACALDARDRFASAGEMAQEIGRAQQRVRSAEPVHTLLSDVTGEIRLADLESTAFERRRQRRGHGRVAARVAFVVAIFLLLGFAAAQALPRLLGPQEVEVPLLVGSSLGEAQSIADDLGVETKVLSRIPSTRAEAGEVLAQAPKSGMIAEGSTIELVLSNGMPKARVPSLKGMELRIAKVRLRAAELKVGSISRRYHDSPKGTVISQKPARGERSWGTKVSLLVSKGPRPVLIPNVVGVKAERAREQLEAAGFVVATVKDHSDDVPKGRVIAMVPSAGEMAPGGTEVTITVSRGPRYKSFKLPDVRNMPVKKARAKLEALNLRVQVRRSCPGNRVIETDPVPGNTVRERDVIALFVC